MKKNSIGKGRKRCKVCNFVCGVRQRVCPSCETPFKISESTAKNEIQSLSELSKGDTFRIIQGSGPYFLSKETKERVYIGASGQFIVEEIDEENKIIHAYGASKKNAGYAVIYMGDDQYVKDVGIWRSKYRIIRTKMRTVWR